MFLPRSVLISSLIVLTLVTLVAACSDVTSTRQSEEAFWQWFQQNDARLYDSAASDGEVFKQLTDQLHKVNSDLVFEFGPKAGGRREFIISASGIRSAFPAVISLANKAPKLAHWKVLKFRQRTSMNDTIEFNGVQVSSKDVHFAIEPQGKLLGITLFIKNYDDSDAYKQIGYLWLDHAIGEYDVETKLGTIDFKALGSDEAHQSEPLTKLAATVDQFSVRKSQNSSTLY